jgi:two-component system CheB/CheR fusion protein
MALIEMSTGELLANLQRRSGRDFSTYRPACLQRRLAMRMSLLRLTTIDEYLHYLSDHPAEIDQLLDTVTIHVTEFFRDHEVFDAIAERLLPALMEDKRYSPSRTIRVWSAGCSTGEEAYSLAILLTHYLQSHELDLELEVYGTDISKEACATARAGRYADRKVARVPAALRHRYFERCEDGYKVANEIKRRVRFTVHDLFAAPAFSLLDIVVCRNVLIHFDSAVRDAVMAKFHASLGDRGILILGKSEAVAGMALEWFELVDPRNKVYRKIARRDS